MKQTTIWKDTLAGIVNTEYVLNNGIRVIHSLTPQALEVVLSIVIKGGASLDGIVGVPRGTAHFLEHMVMGPNDKFSSKEEIDLFEFGTRKSPGLYFNAATSEKHMYITGVSNRKSLNKVFKRMETILGYSYSNFKNRIGKERQIILSERIRTPKHKQNKNTQYKEFMFGHILPDNTHDIAGELNEIKKISIKDLENFHKVAFTTKNLVISIITNKKLTTSIKKRLEVLGALVKRKRKIKIPQIKLENRYRIGHFKDSKEQDVRLSLSYFTKVDKDQKYKETALDFVIKQLIQQVGFDILREKLGLVYSFEPFSGNPHIFDYNIAGVATTVSKKNLLKTIDEIYDLFYTGIESFIYSPKGKTWLENVISKYIYPPTSRYSTEYAEYEASRILESRERFNFDKIAQEAKRLTKEDLLKHSSKLLRDLPPHIFTVSRYNRLEIKNIIKKSKFHKHWN